MELETIRWRDDRVKVICPLASGEEEEKGGGERRQGEAASPDVNQSVLCMHSRLHPRPQHGERNGFKRTEERRRASPGEAMQA